MVSGPTARRMARRKNDMSAEVKNVSGVVKDVVREVKQVAAEVSDRLRQKKEEAKLALDLVDKFGTELGDATAELRALLGQGTNGGPPFDGEGDPTPKKKGLLG